MRDYGTLLDLTGDYAVAELAVRAEDWLTGRTLRELRLRDEGVVVIGIHREGSGYIGAPRPEEVVRAQDTLVLYGQEVRIAELDRRRRGSEGDAAHERACRERSGDDQPGGSGQRGVVQAGAQVGHGLEHGHRA